MTVAARWWWVGAAVVAAAGGYAFGVHGTVAAVVALAIVAGTLVEGGRRKVHLALAGGQLLVFVLVMARLLPERSLIPVRLAGHPDWQVWLAQLALQSVYLGAFLAGRAAASRYRQLGEEIASSARAAERQDALLDEARADYARAVEIARRGAVAPAGPRAIGRALAAEDTHASATLEQPSVVTIDDLVAAGPTEPATTELDDASRATA